MSTSRLSVLSTELVLLVMTHMRTPRDLFAFIRTSKRNYQIFCENQTSILAAIIKSAISPSIFPDAIAACEASQISKLWWAEAPDDSLGPPSHSGHPSFLSAQARFIQQYPHGYAVRKQLLQDHKYLLSLYKLWWVTDQFMADFRKRAFTLASRQVQRLQPGWDDSLSYDEELRLRRAFFRFEIYRRLFPNTVGSIGGPLWDDNSLLREQFFELFSPWEREELLSIQEYLVGLTKEIYQNLQEYVVETIRSMAQESLKQSEKRGLQVEIQSIRQLKASIDLGELDVFQRDGYATSRRFQYLAARGLPFLRWLSNLSQNDRLYMTVGYLGYQFRPTLFESLYSYHRHFQTFDGSAPKPDGINNSRTAGPNGGWTWAESQGLMRRDDGILKRYTLRQLGYVFWRTTRLYHGWELSQTSALTLDLSCRSGDDNDGHRDRGPSIEETFSDIAVPRELFAKYTEGAHLAFKASDRLLVLDNEEFPTPFSEREVELFSYEY